MGQRSDDRERPTFNFQRRVTQPQTTCLSRRLLRSLRQTRYWPNIGPNYRGTSLILGEYSSPHRLYDYLTQVSEGRQSFIAISCNLSVSFWPPHGSLSTYRCSSSRPFRTPSPRTPRPLSPARRSIHATDFHRHIHLLLRGHRTVGPIELRLSRDDEDLPCRHRI